MATAAVGKKGSAADCRARSGRPPKESAGEVEGRILDAARQVFLERGYEGASIEEIREVLLHATVYCGVPLAVDAFRAAQEVLAELAASGA